MSESATLPPKADERIEIEWETYAQYYDSMCEMNPAYDSLLTSVQDKVSQYSSANPSSILDIGAGTGSLLVRLNEDLQPASMIHLDMDHGMNKVAREKYAAQSVSNVQIVEQSVLDTDFDQHSFDVIVSTNAIYSIRPHEQVLKLCKKWLKPTGVLVAVDFGRPQNTNDWVWYIARTGIFSKGLKKTVRFFTENWEAARQNKRTSVAQSQGNYWLHSTEEFGTALRDVGFDVIELSQCYRGYSDLAVCRHSQ